MPVLGAIAAQEVVPNATTTDAERTCQANAAMGRNASETVVFVGERPGDPLRIVT